MNILSMDQCPSEISKLFEKPEKQLFKSQLLSRRTKQELFSEQQKASRQSTY